MILVNNFIPICGYHKVVVTEKKRQLITNLSVFFPSSRKTSGYVKYKTTYMHVDPVSICCGKLFCLYQSDFVKCQNSITKEFQTSHGGGFNSTLAWGKHL